jgi:hypothetical protein
MQYARALSLSHILRVSLRISDALETVSVPGPFSKLNILWGTVMKTGPIRDAQQTKQYVYGTPCDCNRCYISETSRPLEVHIKEHKYNLTQGLLETSKLALHAYKEGHKICWKEAKILQIVMF